MTFVIWVAENTVLANCSTYQKKPLYVTISAVKAGKLVRQLYRNSSRALKALLKFHKAVIGRELT